MSDARFTVDTHLFRELGELLVGRDSTALVELLKNAYDADATRVTVFGDRLQDRERGLIRVSDNGHGMTSDRFIKSFLRIASRIKDVIRPQSPKYHRRFTGAKGIGRLAAHKLARLMEIESVYEDPETGKAAEGFRATINWQKVESVETLSEVPPDAISLKTYSVRPSDQCGTTITLKRLKSNWTERERHLFTSEARSSQVPEILADPLPKSVIDEPLLFATPEWISKGALESDWEVNLEGDFAVGDDYLVAAANAASWILEVDAHAEQVRAAVSPSRAYHRDYPDSNRVTRRLTGLPRTEDAPSFQARILIREGDWKKGTDAAKSWKKADASGVRIYLEGFRVLPYGESGNDWLRIDSTYAKRARGDSGLSKGLFDETEFDKDTYLSYLPVRQYLGGAFLTLDRSTGLKMVVSREGFIPNAAFHYLDDVLTAAINFSVVERSKANAERREERRDSRLASAASKFRSKQTPTSALEGSLEASRRLLKDARQALAAGDADTAKPLIAKVEEAMQEKSTLVGDIRDEQAMMRVLASLGTHTAGFIHELKGLLAVAGAIEQQLVNIDQETQDLPKQDRRRLTESIASLRELRTGLERQAAYVADFASTDARRRRSRQEFAKVFDAALEGFGQQIALRGATVLNELPSDLKSPPMFRAELMAVFSNLISNALKAARKNGRVRVSGVRIEDGSRLRIENTGTAVDVASAEQWFRPFATTSTESDLDLGRGMGLGLTITRRMLAEYGSEIRFVRPRASFSTCLEIEFHG